jgi:hypothetical protein
LRAQLLLVMASFKYIFLDTGYLQHPCIGIDTWYRLPATTIAGLVAKANAILFDSIMWEG